MTDSGDGRTMDVLAMADLKTPWCLRVAVDCGIADRLAGRPREVADLATAAGCDCGALHAVLRYLVSKGVFEEPEDGVFELNDAARQLTDPSVKAALTIDPFGYRTAAVWATLPSYVRTGRPAYHELFGRPFWEDVSADPALGASFDAAMGGHEAHAHDVPLSGGWSDVHHVVDVGGGTGVKLATLLRLHPHLRGTLVDLAGPIARSEAVFEQAGVLDRVTRVTQSFFDPLPAGGDVYLLSGVLHDWDDDDCIAILGRCADAARPDGRVVVPSPFPDAVRVQLDVSMVLVGGRNRTLDEFSHLAVEAGLEVTSTAPATECRPRP